MDRISKKKLLQSFTQIDRSNHSEVFYKVVFLKNFAKFTGKIYVPESLF